MAGRMTWLTVAVLVVSPQLAVNAHENPSAQTLQQTFSKWINARVELEKEQHGSHRGAHENKLAEKRGMKIPDGKYTLYNAKLYTFQIKK